MANSPVELKIVSAVAVSAVLRDADAAKLEDGLRLLSQPGPLFDGDMCVIDVAMLANHQALPWQRYKDVLARYGLCAVAVRNADPSSIPSIQAAGMVLDTGTGRVEQMGAECVATVAAKESESHATSLPPLIVDVPVRAGQRIYARHRDLIVTQVVNNGAELIADGSIHVYAPLRGRALAGASNDTSARIYTLQMEAEIVSIAGIYRNFESGIGADLKGQACEVSLSGQSLNIRRLRAV